MGTLYQIAKERALEYLELPEELPGRPAGTVGMPIQMGRLAGFEHNLEWKAPRTRAQLIGKMLRTSPILSLAEEYLTGRVTSVELTVKRREGVSEEACEALETWLGLGKPRRDAMWVRSQVPCNQEENGLILDRRTPKKGK